MARVKRAVNAKKHHKAILEEAKGYYGDRSRTFRSANQAVQHAGVYAFRDRRARINAGTRMHGMSYSRFIAGLNAAGIEVDRRMLADLAVNDEGAFKAIVAQANDALTK
jgi:large subunit ribosomal protein L20